MKSSFLNRAGIWLAGLTMVVLQLLGFSSASAQNPDTLKSAVPYSVFPMGAMRGYPSDTLQRMIGANFHWDGFHVDSIIETLANEGGLVDTIVTFHDPFYYDTTTSVNVTQLAYGWSAEGVPPTNAPGFLIDAASAVDVRQFMPGTGGVTAEYNIGWDVNRGGPDSDHVEWRFGLDSTLSSGDYVLYNRYPSGGNSNLLMTIPYAYHQLASSVLDSNHIGTTSYESVFFFKPTDLATVSDTTKLYSIEYWSFGNGDSTLLAADTITKNLWNSLAINSAVTQVAGRNVGAEKFSPWNGNSYKLLRRTLNTRPLWKNNFANPPMVDFRIRTFKQISMYFRLVRIRDWRAQRLLTGKADSVLGLAIAALKVTGDNIQKTSWTLSNEFYSLRFHAWAYVNDLFIANHAPPANILNVWTPDLFVRVLRDQSQSHVPAHLWYEWEPFAGNGWKNQGVDSKTHIAYSFWGANPVPIPSDVASDSIFWQARDIFIQKDYDAYTATWQQNIIGFGSERSGGGTGLDSALSAMAHSCYEIDPPHPIPFLMTAQALADAFHKPKWTPVDSIYWTMGGNQSAAALHYADSAYGAVVINPYLKRHPGERHVPEDSLYDVDWFWRPPTVSEMYYTLWSGITHGIKGYNYNIGYDDGELQNGFLWDTLPGVILKSQQRDYIEFQEEGAGHLESPYEFGYKYDPPNASYIRWAQVPPAFKTMFPTIQTLMRDELGPIAAKLAVLNWRGTVSWPWRDSAPIYLGRLPVQDVRSRTMSGEFESDRETYVDLGIHTTPTEPNAIYISLQNRRLWTDSTGTSTKDNRIISFRIDPSKFPVTNAKTWSVTDVSGRSPQQLLKLNERATYQLKPGQGILLRIAAVSES